MDTVDLRSALLENFGAEFMPRANVIAPQFNASAGAKMAQQLFAGKLWNNIEISLLFHSQDALRCLSDEAFGYYIAAYINLIILSYYEADALVDTVISMLTPPASQGSPRLTWVNSRLGAINNPQRIVIASFLKFLEAEYSDFGARNALEVFWHTYC